jgi:hypothetical protein
MKPIARQLIVAAFILALVTVASLGIRQIRFSIYRARTVESPVIAEIQPEPKPADSRIVDAGPGPQYASALEPDEQGPSEDPSEAESDTVDAEADPQHAEAPESDQESFWRDYAGAKPFKGYNAKSEGSKGLEKISLGDQENLYITGEGELWYVSKQPDGKSAKMQVQIDGNTGEMTVVGKGGYGRSGGSRGLQRIPMGDCEDLYITEEGRAWYVTEQPDGSATKMQVQLDETTGEIAIIDGGDSGK